MTRTFLCLLICFAACACSAHRLRCDGPLQPINPPQNAEADPMHAAATGKAAP